MTSEERHEARYRRRKAERQRRRDARSEACGSFEQVFSYEHLYRAGRECCKGVGWKCSTQRYLGNFTANIARTHRELMDGTWKTKGFFAFDLMERGKLRHIRSVHIAERVVQRCLCDNALVPLFSAAFVYDNAASLKGKGIDFAMDTACGTASTATRGTEAGCRPTCTATRRERSRRGTLRSDGS